MKRHVVASLIAVLILAGALCATAGPEFVEEPTIPEGKALVYIYCPKGYYQTPAAVKATVLADEQIVAVLSQGCYFPYFTAPERIDFSAVERSTHVALEVEEGREYYVRIGSGMKRWEFAVVTRERAMNEITACRLPDSVAE